MKKYKFSKVILVSCVIALFLGLASIALAAGKPSFTYSSSPGYVMFKDSAQDMIQSDNPGKYPVYADCSLGGSDMVEICIWDDGTFKYINFYPGVMQKSFYKCVFGTFSLRRVKFKFNVSGIVGSQPTGNAVRDILRWYKDASGNPQERNLTNPGFIDDDSLHVPICVYRTGHSQFQFGIDPAPRNTIDGLPPDPRAVTQYSVNNFYSNDTDVIYWCTRTEPDKEPAPYVIYNIDYGAQEGFDVQPVQWGTDGKPVTWIVKTKARRSNNPVRLYVLKDNEYGQAVYLANYSSLPFEFAVSLKSITSYPVTAQAPPKINTISTTWGEIKGE